MTVVFERQIPTLVVRITDVDDSMFHRDANGTGDHTAHIKRVRTLIGIDSHIDVALHRGRDSDIKRPFDGARRAHIVTGGGLFFIGAHIQIVLQP